MPLDPQARAYLDQMAAVGAPLHARDHSGLPPALVITAEFDPLHDEGAAYARCLSEAGVPTKHSDYDAMIHGFFGLWAYVDRSKEAIAEVAETLKAAFALHGDPPRNARRSSVRPRSAGNPL